MKKWKKGKRNGKKKQYNVIVCACACGCYRHVRVSTLSSPFNTSVVGGCERLGVGCSVGGIGRCKKKKGDEEENGQTKRSNSDCTSPPCIHFAFHLALEKWATVYDRSNRRKASFHTENNASADHKVDRVLWPKHWCKLQTYTNYILIKHIAAGVGVCYSYQTRQTLLPHPNLLVLSRDQPNQQAS